MSTNLQDELHGKTIVEKKAFDIIICATLYAGHIHYVYTRSILRLLDFTASKAKLHVRN